MPEHPRPNVYAVDHIAIAVRDAEEALPLWEKILGVKGTLVVNEQVKLKEAVFWVGGVQIQLCSSTAPGIRYQKFCDERGEGLNHFGLAVHDMAAALGDAKSLNMKTRFRFEGPAEAPHQSIDGRISFVEPHQSGFFLEYVERYNKRRPPVL